MKLRIIVLSVFALPLLVSAQEDIGSIIDGVGGIVFSLIPIAFALAILFFLWGLAKFILHADNEDKREEGKQIMKWGIVALFVLVSVWGIVDFLRAEFTIEGDGAFPIPRP